MVGVAGRARQSSASASVITSSATGRCSDQQSGCRLQNAPLSRWDRKKNVPSEYYSLKWWSGLGRDVGASSKGLSLGSTADLSLVVDIVCFFANYMLKNNAKNCNKHNSKNTCYK